MAFSLFSALALVALHLTLTSDLHAETMGVKISQEQEREGEDHLRMIF